jgi:hypothetical protein
MWSRYPESNRDQKFRKLLFYPLNYSEIMAGLERIELPPSVSKTEMISISPKTETGTAYRNRTHIRRVETCRIIHYTKAVYILAED